MYRGIGARLLHALKYEGATWLRPQIEAFVLQSMVARDHLCGCVLVPIPLHWWKLSRRGYNQADIIAAAICNVIPDCRIQHCLRRRQHTTSQTMLSKSERLQNMAGVFQACKIEGASPRFMLVDDVLTTGATLNSAAHAMREAGALRISAFTLAHG